MPEKDKRGPDYLRLRYQERRQAMGARAALIAAIAVAVGILLAWIQDSQRQSLEEMLEARDSVTLASSTPSIWSARNRSNVVIQDCPNCPELIGVPAGRLAMGLRYETYSLLDIPARQAALELPLHWAEIEAFSIGRSEVTKAAFAEYADAKGLEVDDCDTSAGVQTKASRGLAGWQQPGFQQFDNHPVVCVSWQEANQYAAWLSEKTGQSYRLPREAEWEWAARAGTQGAWFWGNDAERACGYVNGASQSGAQTPPQDALFPCDDGIRFTTDTNSGQTNPAGLNHMIGNAAEWTLDCMTTGYNPEGTLSSSEAQQNCPERVVRGGSWSDGPVTARASSREPRAPDYRSNRIGFRLVRELPPE